MWENAPQKDPQFSTRPPLNDGVFPTQSQNFNQLKTPTPSSFSSFMKGHSTRERGTRGAAVEAVVEAEEAKERDGTTWARSGRMFHVVRRVLNPVVVAVSGLYAVQWHLLGRSMLRDERGKRCGRHGRARMCARAHGHQPQWYLRYPLALQCEFPWYLRVE